MTLHVINPNSLVEVTQGIAQAIAPMADACPVAIETHTLSEGPPGIETDAHIAEVVAPLTRRIRGLERGASAFVIACYSDPGKREIAQQVSQPVIGIGEAAVLTALRLGGQFGTISIGAASVPRHMAKLEEMGLAERCAGDLPLSLSVRELADPAVTWERLCEVGAELRDRHGAGSLILGCAGMAQYRARLAERLSMQVIDPCQAATAMAIGAIALQRATEERSG